MSTTIDLTETLAAWTRITDAATPGEWGSFQKVADDAEFSLDADMETTTSSVECITGLRTDDGGQACITIADPIVSAADAEFIALSRTIVPALLSAVENVLKVCDATVYSADRGYEDGANDALSEVRKALTDALGGK